MEIRPFPIREERGIPLLRAIWEDIKADRSAWDQVEWIGKEEGRLDREVVKHIVLNRRPPWNCGTAACIAGHTVLSAGALLTRDAVSAVTGSRGGFLSTSQVFDPATGAIRMVCLWAQELLDLDEAQADVLFAASNDEDTIEALVTALEHDPEANLHAVRNARWLA